MDNKSTLQSIHNDDFEKEVFRLKEFDFKKLLKFKDKFKENYCPACESVEKEYKFEKYGIEYHQCKNCKTLYVSPCPTEEIKKWYLENSESLKYWRNNMPDHVRASRNKVLYNNRVQFIISIANEFNLNFNSVIEIGGGMGELAIALMEKIHIDKYTVVEPQPLDIKSHKIEVIRSTIEAIQLEAEFDLVLAFELLEHIVRPEIFMEKIKLLLKKKGLLIISTPNSAGFDIQVLNAKARAIGYDHVSLFNSNSIKLLLERFGFEILKIVTPGKLDVEMIKKEFEKDNSIVGDNMALKYLLENDNKYNESFQEFLVKNLRSSHMLCVAIKK